MAEFIGSRISLISKRDIRYVGTLHEISSENSTVALEQVMSFGTEGRRPDDEVAPSDVVYDYIMFRGSDVKDLRIEEGPKENNPPPKPAVPDDPAILGSARRPAPSSASNTQVQQETAGSKQQSQQSQNQQLQKPASQQQPQQRHQQPPTHFQQQPPYPYPYPPPNPRFGPQGFPPGPGFSGMPYGAPPGWYPPPGYGYPPMPPNQFHPPHMPIGPPGQPPRHVAPEPAQKAPTPTGSAVNEATKPIHQPNSPLKPLATVKLPSSSTTPAPLSTQQSGPPPPVESKPDVAAALAPPAPALTQVNTNSANAIPVGPKGGRIIPAIPLPSPLVKPISTTNGAPKAAAGNAVQADSVQTQPQPAAAKTAPPKTKTFEEASHDARAAVAAAMAKLPPAPGQKKQVDGTGAMDNLTRKVNEMRTNDNIRTSRQPGTGGYAAGHRGGERGNHRGNRRHTDQQGKKVEVPTTDYDFESANAKFNKQDLVKEAIASGSPLATPVDETSGAASLPTTNGDKEGGETKATNPTVAYNKSSSFFDNISSESKDRSEGDGHRVVGREFRSEERQKNLETFGQGSVDNGYRGGYGRGGRGRGRGHGRGRGGIRGGYESRGARNGVRGGRGAVATEG